MSKYKWANPEKQGVVSMRDGVLFFIDSGDEYEAAVAGKPDVFAGAIADPLPSEADTAESLADDRSRMICSRFQAKAALLNDGLLPQIETLMTGADALTKLAWAEAVEFRRDSPTIALMAATAGMNETQLDDLFRAAMTITA